MLQDLQPDIRQLLTLTRKMATYDATIAASQLTDKPIQPLPAAVAERKRQEQEALHLQLKWGLL